MISQFNAYIKTISTLIIFSAFVRIIMPDNNFKSYISLILGIIVAGSVLKPVIKIFSNNNFDFSDIVKEYKFENIDITKDTQDIKNKIIYSAFKEKLDEDIKIYLEKTFFEAVNVNCIIDEISYEILEINIKVKEVKNDNEVIKSISDRYGVNEENIFIELQKN